MAVLWGARAIGRRANIVDENDEVEISKVYYLLENGLLDADKTGRIWTSTEERIDRQFAGKPNSETQAA
jgi:hypothetical protein